MRIDTYMRLLLDEACQLLEVDKDYVTNRKRTRLRKYVRVRQMIIRCVHNIKGGKGGVSLKDIGKYFGGIDHSSVIHNIQQANNHLNWEPDFLRDYRKVEAIAISLDAKINGMDKSVIYHFLYDSKETQLIKR